MVRVEKVNPHWGDIDMANLELEKRTEGFF